jgi:hypothetical protein
MENEKIEVEVRINKLVDVEVDLYDIIDKINNLPNLRKWNYVGYILSQVNLDLSETTEEQKNIIKDFLEKKLTALKL